MKKAKLCISIFFLALLLFPIGKKAMHEVGHLYEQHCDVHEKHFCAVDHDCSLCDYVFSSGSLPPANNEQTCFKVNSAPDFIPAVTGNILTPEKLTLFLRGPPHRL